MDYCISNSLARFLRAKGLLGGSLCRLDVGLSKKEFWRVTFDERSYIVLDWDPVSIELMVARNSLLSRHNISVPVVLEVDSENGFVVFEDVGGQTLSAVLDSGLGKFCLEELFSKAVKTINDIQGIPVSEALSPLSMDDYIREVDTITNWYIPDITGSKPTTRVVLEVFDALRATVPKCELLPKCVSHRDFYSGNIMVRMSDECHELVIIDYEDLAIASPAYDLVSLLQDLRRRPQRELEGQMIDLYLRCSHFDESQFLAEYAAFGALRAMRVLGLWRRLKNTTGSRMHLDFHHHTRTHLEDNLKHPELEHLHEMYVRILAPIS